MKGFIGNRARLVAYTSAVGLFVFVALLAFPVVETSEAATAATGTALPSTTTLTLSSTNDNAFVNVVPNATQGTFSASDANGTAGFSVTTNNFTGYTLSISSSDDTGKLENYTHDYIESISSNLTETDFSAASNTSYNNKWGFKPNKYVNNNTVVDNTGSNSVFLPSPTTTPTVLNITSAANTADDNYTIGLGLRADLLLPSGVYSKTLNLIALANVIPYTVNFDQNTTDTTVANMPSGLDSSTSATGITIPNITPTRTNYTFVGWCNRKDTINTCPTGGTVYQPGSDYGIDQTSSNTGITLYAMWQPNFYMQEVAMWGQSLAIGDSVQAVDRRDGKIYWVTKEETDPANPRAEIDATTGKAYQIWMTQNLDLDLSSSITLTPATSDVTNNWAPLNSTLTDISGWADSNNTPYSYDSGTKYYYTSGGTDDDITYSSLSACTEANHTAEDCAHYHSGNYYNWSSAVANNDTSTYVNNYTEMPDSICPAGWRLPTGLTAVDGYSDFGYLLNKNSVIPSSNYGTADQNTEYASGGLDKLRSAVLWFTRSGFVINSSTFYGGGIETGYLSSSVFTNGMMYYAPFDNTRVYPAYRNYRKYGLSVRCLARNTMQNSTVANIAAFTSTTADNNTKFTDARDGKVYTVGKMSDGSIWMTKNLDLAGGTTITSVDSNVANSYTLPASSTEGFDNNNVANAYNSSSTSCANNEPCYSYYNYIAATAGTNPNSGSAEYDICPKGWRLPTVAEYSDLAMMYPNNATLNVAPWYGVNAGGYFNGEFSANTGYYRSSTVVAQEAVSAYTLRVRSGNVGADIDYSNKSRGMSIRCVKKQSISDLLTLQDFARLGTDSRSEVLRSMEAGVSYQLKDSRDNEVYNIAKLADGNIWLQDNLRLGSDSPTPLTPADTNISSNYTLPASIDDSFGSYTSAQINTDSKIAEISYGAGSGKAGTYYNFCAASAGTICATTSTDNAQYDVCPKGWRIPTGGASGEYQALYTAYSEDYSSLVSALHITFSGYYNGSTHNAYEGGGYYWSSTMNTDARMHGMDVIISTGTIRPQDSTPRHLGITIRCILDATTIDNISTMQDFDALTPLQRKNTLSSMVEGQQYTLEDSRDNKSYTIAKLSDGTIWMTKNLDLAGNTALYSDTSNVPSGYPTSGGTPYYTLPASDINGFSNATTASVYNSNSTTCGDNSSCYSYYNYAAATANTNPSANDATYDICPKGWRLPVKTEYDSIVAMYNTGSIITTSAWQGVYSGNIQGGGVSSGGVAGYYQSSTADTSGLAWAIVYGESVNVNRTYNKIYGFAVRCVLNTTLQDTTVDMLGDLIPDAGDTVVLSDKRDGEKYTIGRLADGNVWMLENLRLGDASTMALTTYNTNILNNWTLPSNISTGFNSRTVAQINIDSKNTTQIYGDNNGSGKIGTYYNYCAASAGTICTETNINNATADVCPRGWRMPTGGAEGEYRALYVSYSNNIASFTNALKAVFSGFYEDYSWHSQGSGGYYWSSTQQNDTYMYNLDVNNTPAVGPQNYNPRHYGFTIRCIKSY